MNSKFLQALVRLIRHQPMKVVETSDADPDQAYFWTPEWQAEEREADEDIRAGRVERYNSKDAFLNSLKSTHDLRKDEPVR